MADVDNSLDDASGSQHDEMADSSSAKGRSSVACLSCRRSKLRCDFAERAKVESDPACSRCRRTGRDCTAIPGQKGRKLGSKNKPKTKPEGAELSPPLAVSGFSIPSTSAMTLDNPVFPQTSLSMPLPSPPLPYATGHLAGVPPLSWSVDPGSRSVTSEERARFAMGSSDQQNPLSLLAEASHTAQTPVFGFSSLDGQSSAPHLAITADTPTLGLRIRREVLQEGLRSVIEMPVDGPTGLRNRSLRTDYFASSQRTDRRDLDDALDPCELGLLDEADLPRLFATHFAESRAAPTLDPDLHTPAYVRSHSALLLTTIALLAAQSTAGEALLTKRLHGHAQFLRKEVYRRNYCSVEIIQALNLLAVWSRSGASLADDQSGSALAQAIAMAIELGLERDAEGKRGPSGLPLEGDADARRHQRNRERTLFTLYTWDRSLACGTGRSFSFPDSLLPPVEGWDKHPLATKTDAGFLQHVMIRMESSAIRSAIRNEHLKGVDLGRLPGITFDLVSERLGRWHVQWQAVRHSPAHTARQNAALQLIYDLTRVWTLAIALPFVSHASDGSGEALVSALQAAALESCETFVLQSGDLPALPINVSVLVIYSALMALKLQQAHGVPESLPTILGLLAQVASLLEQSGSNPPHRAGPTSIFGQHLLLVLRGAALSASPGAQANGEVQGRDSLLFGGPEGPPSMLQDGMGPMLVGEEEAIGVDAWPPLDWLAGAWPEDVADALSWAVQTH